MARLRGHTRKHQGSAATAFSGGPATKAPRTPLREVECSSCGAQPGQVCRSANGNDLPAGHRPRRAAAARLYNERREAERAAQPVQVVVVVETVVLGIHAWHAECRTCGWSCLDRHSAHNREVRAIQHAERHVCG